MKKKILVMLLTVTMGFSLLAGCGEGAKAETGANAENTTTDVKNPGKENEPETEEISSMENVQEKVERIKPNEWIKSLNLTEKTVFIWNYLTAKGTIISEGETYLITDDDKLLVYSPEKIDGTITNPKENIKVSGELDSGYYLFDVNLENETEVDMELISGDSSTFIKFTLTKSNYEEERKNNTKLTGDEWIQTLAKDNVEYPIFVAWNDNTGTKAIIEDGGEYIWQEGDNIAVYTENEYAIMSVLKANIDVTYDIQTRYEKIVFDEKLLEETQELIFNVVWTYDNSMSEMSINIVKPNK